MIQTRLTFRKTTLLAVLLAFLCGYAQEETVISLKIMTYNIRHGAGMDNVVDLKRQADVISNSGPDLVALQEVDSIVPRSGKVNETAFLAREIDMKGTFGPAIPLSGGKYGVAILSREEPLSVKNIPLPGKEPRTLLVCEFEHYVFASTHLDLVEENRLASLSTIIEEAKSWDKPFFICGDWNDNPSSTLIKRMKASFSFLNYIYDSKPFYTFPADKPTSTIDYIATYGEVVKSVVKRQVINEPAASDHRPVFVEVQLDVNGTDISQLADDRSDRQVYDLAGRRLCGKSLTHGLYIKKAKKILAK